MPIFNETFTDDKPIFYPSNWETGKTADQLYLQWKLTTQYFILSNVLQCVIAGLWLCFVYVICSAIKHMWRLYSLPDDKRQKIQNRQYIDKSFIMSACFMAFIAFSVTVSLAVMNEFTRYALIKGLVFCFSILSGKKLYQKGRAMYFQSKERKSQYEKIKKQEQTQRVEQAQ